MAKEKKSQQPDSEPLKHPLAAHRQRGANAWSAFKRQLVHIQTPSQQSFSFLSLALSLSLPTSWSQFHFPLSVQILFSLSLSFSSKIRELLDSGRDQRLHRLSELEKPTLKTKDPTTYLKSSSSFLIVTADLGQRMLSTLIVSTKASSEVRSNINATVAIH